MAKLKLFLLISFFIPGLILAQYDYGSANQTGTSVGTGEANVETSSEAGAALRTNCDDQPKPAFGCREGYSMMCVPAGGDHWACAKEVNGRIMEWSPDVAEGSVEAESKLEVETKSEENKNPGARKENSETSAAPDVKTEEKHIFQNNQTDLDFVGRGASSVSVKAVEVRGWDPKQKEEFLQTIKLHAEVSSGEDLENFARGVLLKDENVAEVQTDEKSVSISYKMPARFLGIFSASINAKASVEVDENKQGRVKVRFPWYRVFFRTSDNIKADVLENEIGAEIDDEVLAAFENGDAADPKIRAELLETLSHVLKDAHDTAKSIIQNIRA